MAETASIRTYDDHALQLIAGAALKAGELTGTTRHDIERWQARLPADPTGTLVALAGDEVAGFFSSANSLVVVAPGQRRRGHGRRLVEAALAEARMRGEARLYLAPPRGSAIAAAFATRLGFRYHSSLWQLRLLAEIPTPPAGFPPDIAVRPVRADEVPAYVALINAAFADHPSPIRVSERVVRHVHGLPGFDPTDILVVAPRDRPGHLIAFCRMELVREAGACSGDVALIGVLPAWRGRGLGRALLAWGIGRLRDAGAADVTLSVEASNERALRLYERTGFERAQEWPRWAKETSLAATERTRSVGA